LFAKTSTIDILVDSIAGVERIFESFATIKRIGYRSTLAKLSDYVKIVRYGLEILSDTGVVILVSGSPSRHCNLGKIALSFVVGAVEAVQRNVAKKITPKRIYTLCPGQ